MIEVHIPKMGMSTTDVDVTQVMVAVGQLVKAGDPLVEIEGDKAVFVIEAEGDGRVVELLVEVGGNYDVGHVACRLEETNDQ
ncbi:MAG: lipoyl domain-containing protein [Acidimicrobiales bacterium]|jgi:pyruvate dehydrogenase E2 component (dihydrolipoamide acetyltransferase)